MNPGKRWIIEVSAEGRADLNGAEPGGLTPNDSLALADALNTLAGRLRVSAARGRPRREPCA